MAKRKSRLRVRPNGLAFGKFGEGFQLDCKFLPIIGQFQKPGPQLWSVCGYGQFGAARCVSMAFFGITWHGTRPLRAARREPDWSLSPPAPNRTKAGDA